MIDMNQYLELFIDEAKEHLQSLNQHILELEKSTEDIDVLNEVFRVAHTLKGMAATMSFTKVTELTHNMENVFQEVRDGNIEANATIVDALFKCLDALEGYIDNIAETGSEGESILCKNATESLNAILSTRCGAIKDDKVDSDSDFFNEYDKNIINRAINSGMNAYGIVFKLNKDCVMKAARAFIIFRKLEEVADIIKSEPIVEDIEDEKFESEFTVIIISEQLKEQLNKELNTISEIDSITISQITAFTESYTDESDKNRIHINDIKNTNKDANKGTNKEILNKKQNTLEANNKLRPGKTVRVGIDRLDNLMNLVSELIIIKTRLVEGESKKAKNGNSEVLEYMERTISNLHDVVMKVRMIPIEMVFNRFPRMIRDISKELDKKITLNIYGAETELDRTVIDEISDPLIHLIRNSADHGIESKERRKAQNKPETGTIQLKAYHAGNSVVIEVQDDGAGIDTECIKQMAIDKNLITEEKVELLTQKEIIDFLFQPNFSTAECVTDISGRGVGLDVVKTKIQSLGGTIEVETIKGEGSKFNIRIPLTLAIIQALLVVLGKEIYAIPLNSIMEILNIENNEVTTIQNQNIITVRDNVISLIDLGKVLDVEKQEDKNQTDLKTVVIVKKGEKSSAFEVDSVIGQQEIVIRSLGKHLSATKDIAGATILGDGQVALILDINSLIS